MEEEFKASKVRTARVPSGTGGPSEEEALSLPVLTRGSRPEVDVLEGLQYGEEGKGKVVDNSASQMTK